MVNANNVIIGLLADIIKCRDKMKILKKINSLMAINLYEILLLALILVPFILGKYCELNIPGPFDSGAYTYSAKHVLDGAQIGVDEVPSAKVGTLLMNMLGVKLFGYSDVGPKIVQGFFQLIALGMMYFSSRKFFGKFASFLCTFVASFMISAPLIAKFGNVKEQFMVAFMVIGISAFVLYLGTKIKWLAIISGGFLGWAPLFKVTGFSAGAAVVILVSFAFIFKWRDIKTVAMDVLLLLIGFTAITGPVWCWLNITDSNMSTPYKSVFKILGIEGSAKPTDELSNDTPIKEVKNTASKVKSDAGYAERTRQARGYDKQAPVIFRYYKILWVPIALGLASLILVKVRFARTFLSKTAKIQDMEIQDIIAFMLLWWWIFDAALVWVSTRPYEQYYIPMTASGAFAGVYFVWWLLKLAAKKGWQGSVVVIALLCIVTMAGITPIYAGLTKSPYSGEKYGDKIKRRGYVQQIENASNHRTYKVAPGWEMIGLFIKQNTTPEDRTFVWGWYPGIYVKAERLSTYKKAFESEMHTRPPHQLEKQATAYIESFEKYKPKYIVDSRKIHFPNDRPPLEFWPSTPNGFLPNDPRYIAAYDKSYCEMIKDIDPVEVERYMALSQLRKYIMDNYDIVDKAGYQFTRSGPVNQKFQQMVIFRRKNN